MTRGNQWDRTEHAQFGRLGGYFGNLFDYDRYNSRRGFRRYLSYPNSGYYDPYLRSYYAYDSLGRYPTSRYYGNPNSGYYYDPYNNEFYNWRYNLRL
jgi:hypothetical protein